SAHVGEIHWLAGSGAVEVDHVQPGRPRIGPPPRCDDGIVVVGLLPPVVALDQADGLAAADVDRRVENQRQNEVKVPKNLSAAALDFSGWNCTPYKGGRSTAQAKHSP